AGPYAFGL
uniref:Carcinustatin-8 n=1 Tax=Carcinus maenas TaxID=6759 RepID=ALL8_CARMA|nr:RecName: Full=Carcinustatin-8 [Carcinus maenas]